MIPFQACSRGASWVFCRHATFPIERHAIPTVRLLGGNTLAILESMFFLVLLTLACAGGPCVPKLEFCLTFRAAERLALAIEEA